MIISETTPPAKFLE